MKLYVITILISLFSAACIPAVQAQRNTTTDNLRVTNKIRLGDKTITRFGTFFNQASTPGGTLYENDLWYNPTDSTLNIYDGAAWGEVARPGGGSGGGGDPTMGGDLSGTASNAQIVPGAVGSTELASGAVTLTKEANGTADRLKGYDGSGNPSEINITGNATLSGGTLNVTGGDPTMGGDLSGTASNAQIVANAVGSNEIAPISVTAAKMENIAANTIVGRNDAGSGDREELTPTEVTAMLNIASAGVKGLAPPLSGLPTQYLDGTGTFSVPPGGTDDQTLAEVLSSGNSAGSTDIDMNGQDITNLNPEAYGAGWNGDNSAPTKNDVYNKIELIVGGGGDGVAISGAWDDANNEIDVTVNGGSDFSILLQALLDSAYLWSNFQGVPAGFADDTDDVNDADSDPANEKNLNDHTGDIATSQVENDAVTAAKMENIAANTIVGRNDAGSGDREELTPTEVTAMLNIASAGVKGLAPPLSGLPTQYLDGTGTFSVPPGGGGFSPLTDNYVPRALGQDDLENSQIYDNGATVSINSATPPGGKLFVNGNTRLDGRVAINRDFVTNRDFVIQSQFSQPLISLYDNGGTEVLNFGATTANDVLFDAEVSGKSLIFRTAGNNERLRILSSGNIGIGDNSPAERLTVSGNIRTSGQVQFEGSANYINNDGADNLGVVTGTGNNFFVNVEGGSQEIDVSPTGLAVGTVLHANKLDVEGGAAIGSSYSGTSTAPADGLLVEGSVAIGATSPEAKLHIEDLGSYLIMRSTNASLSTRITLENEGDDNDSWQVRRNNSGEFAISHSALQPYGTETDIIELTSSEIRLLQDLVIDTGNDVRIIVGSGSPESSVTAGVGSTYHRSDGGTGTSLYVKESGTGNTGWVAK